MLEQVTGIIFLIIWLLIANKYAWDAGYYYNGSYPYRLTNLSVWHVIGAFSLFFLIQLILVPSFFLAYHYLLTSHWSLPLEWYGWINLIGMVAAAVAFCAYCYVCGESVFSILSTGPLDKFSKDFSLGSVSWLICFPLVSLVGILLQVLLDYLGLEGGDQAAVDYLKQIYDNQSLFWASFFTIMAIVPFLEEALFRGFLQTWLKQKIGRSYAILFTSLVFAGFHLSKGQGWNNIKILAALFLLSIYLGYLYERRASIWAPIGLHATFNMISEVMIIVLGEGGKE